MRSRLPPKLETLVLRSDRRLWFKPSDSPPYVIITEGPDVLGLFKVPEGVAVLDLLSRDPAFLEPVAPGVYRMDAEEIVMVTIVTRHLGGPQSEMSTCDHEDCHRRRTGELVCYQIKGDKEVLHSVGMPTTDDTKFKSALQDLMRGYELVKAMRGSGVEVHFVTPEMLPHAVNEIARREGAPAVVPDQ